MDPEESQGPRPGPAETPETETVRGWPGGPPQTPIPVPEPEPLARGTQVGRYVLLDAVGSGGMGVVYAAYDPELDRKVAIKLLRFDRLGSEAGERDRLRLQREAQAIARLSHPNVVQVYDVGTFGDQVFVAMEFVAGRTLRQWAEEGPRPWREVVDRFVLAGRGLAAAHAAGLVHRDFKPDNVLLGDDGRVRVVDFGLARPSGEGSSPGGGRTPAGGTLSHPLTEWGVVVGTPAYMAPEQLRGEAADERSDQFSFCASLYETLYGGRPFPGETVGDFAVAYARGEAPRPPERVKVPARVRQALLRGLGLAPAGRFPSMEELLRELERDASSSRRRWLAAAAVLLLAAAGLGQWGWNRAQLCSGAEARLAGVWDGGRKQAVRAAFLASDVPFAAGAWTGVERALDRHAQEWAQMHREACETTRIRGEQSEELLDRRMACLDQRLREVKALASLFSRADAGVVQRAGEAAGKLTPVTSCADTAALTERVPLPRDPGQRSRIQALQGELAEAKALADSGKDSEALERLGRLLPAVQSAGYRPLEAEVLFLTGTVQDRLGRSPQAEGTLFESLLAAQEGGHPEVFADAAAQLSWVSGAQQNRLQEGQRWARLAQSSIERLEGSEVLAGRLSNRLGAVLYAAGRYEEAAVAFRRADRLGERSLGPDNPVSAAALSNLAIALDLQGKSTEALQAASRALAIRRRLLEPDHPDLARSYNGLGNIHATLGNDEEALAMYRKALEIITARYGALHPLAVGIESNVGNSLRDLGRLEEALLSYQRCVRALERLDPEGAQMGMMLVNIGTIMIDKERYREALPLFQRATFLDEKNLEPSHPDLSYALEGMGSALQGLGRSGEAVVPLERALKIREAGKIDPHQVAVNRFYLAQALWDSGRRERALRETRRAMDELAGVGDGAKDRAEIEAWLRERGQGGAGG